jgi:AAA15 family ATPase/GTPase
MQLKAVRIKNFRTVSDEVTFHVSRRCALIGVNNAGKSNILHAIHLFFSYQIPTIINSRSIYSRNSDFPWSTVSG